MDVLSILLTALVPTIHIYVSFWERGRAEEGGESVSCDGIESKNKKSRKGKWIKKENWGVVVLR